MAKGQHHGRPNARGLGHARLDELERQAIGSTDEGALATILAQLESEIQSEKAHLKRIQEAIGDFGHYVPYIKGEMGKALALAEEEGQQFEETEIKPESELHKTKRKAMRQRVSDRLYAARPEFRRIMDSDLDFQRYLDETLNPGLQLAQKAKRAFSRGGPSARAGGQQQRSCRRASRRVACARNGKIQTMATQHIRSSQRSRVGESTGHCGNLTLHRKHW